MKPMTVQDLEIDSLQSLAQAKVGCDFQIRYLEGPGCDQLRRLGFCGTRLAVSSALAEQVIVSPVTAS